MKRLRHLSGSSDEARIINAIIDELETLKVKAGPGIRLHNTPKGTLITADPGGPPADPPVSDWFQGDWSAGRSYEAGHGVRIVGGISAGFYMCHTDAPAGTAAPTPSNTANWTLIVSGNAMGNWM